MSDENIGRGSKFTSRKRSQSQEKDRSSKKKSKKSRMKKDTIFDEFDKRGDVLEGYEDLNSASSSDDNVLSQIYDQSSRNES